ncbi:MAG TPA: bile acid:sodium symporter family protein [Anaerohalosphaeraceae bacterium]|nr:bile acid:sodium symporter family protein [Anaerohalosphaeraceae bacterium]HOL31362.1 bile acid:sodium symporter family protein [Anaerohalosphaeraceae bacterium]HOM75182.1 bile acid:sodium symporter family protein [Anaerohalosphaeraceae bacterium]HPC63563.1 bile acid:sodium symporter family protein [Anaerohalosphaeraceae bacterium]HPO69691.1 bile acid:sodium symporter family protein [Anaerohalosphaeraceae bacterium]
MEAVQKAALGFFFTALLVGLIAWAGSNEAIAKGAGTIAAAALPVGLGAVPILRGYRFTAWIAAAVICPLLVPHVFLNPQITETFSININHPWAVLMIIQLVMFGMGTQMSIRDFAGVVKMPYPVAVGLVCQFTIMPLVGFLLAKVFGFPPEIGAGLVLIGSCSSGLASNVMAYMACINLPLSITLTACATALAPFITPFWLTTLNTGIEKNFEFVDAMMSIFKIVIAPIGAAMVHDLLKHAGHTRKRVVYGIAAAGGLWLLFLAGGGWKVITKTFPVPVLTNCVTVVSFLLAAVLAGVIYHFIALKIRRLDSFMPRLSMFGIIYFTAIATASGRNELLTVGLLLFAAAAAHNLIGYLLGYWLSRLLALEKSDARTVAIEVGMQNGGMAFGIASDLGKLATLGLAAAIFSPWMNVSGSILANFWRKHPIKDNRTH